MLKHFLIVVGIALMAFNMPQCSAQGNDTSRVDLTYAADQAVNSVVYIKVTTNAKVQTVPYSSPFDDFFSEFFGQSPNQQRERQIQTPKRSGAGSGVILTSDGYIVTNNHVVAEADELTVKLNDNREFKARIIGLDETTDLALIKIEAEGLPAIKVGDSSAARLGEWVLAIGNPFGLTGTVTAGVVSAKARTLHASGGIEAFIQTDAAINPGNSGGALVNAKGELIGINAMLYSRTGSFSGYGFAIPTTIMQRVVDDLRNFGTVQRAVLGVQYIPVDDYVSQQKERGNDVELGTVNGIYINEVTPESAAAEAGIQKGDVITHIGDMEITKSGELQEALATHRPGDKVKLTYLRDKKRATVHAVLNNAQGTTTVLSKIDQDHMGVALEEISAKDKQALNLNYGLVVKHLREGKMKQAGVTKGLILLQVNDVQLRTGKDWDEALKQANLSTDRVLWIRAKTQSGLNKSFTVELDEKK